MKKNPKKCLVCGKKLFVKMFPVRSDYSYAFCQECCNWILSRTPINIKSIYTRKYFENPSPINPFWAILYRFSLHSSYDKWVDRLQPKKGTLLDVGCGDGGFLKIMLDDGWKVYGTDVAPSVKGMVEERVGKGKFSQGDLTAISNLKSNSFDAITMWHVLEHLENPSKNLAKINRLLKKDGRIFIEVPNGDSLTLKIFGKYYNWIRVPEHTIYWTSKGMSQILKRHGFKDIEIFSPPKANLNFSLSFKNALNSKKVNHQLGNILFLLSLPVSLSWSYVVCLMRKGEVLRVTAERK